MSLTKALNVQDGDPLAAIVSLLRSILSLDDIRAVLAPRHLPMKAMVMPALMTDPEMLAGVDPLSPAFPMNTAKVAAKLTRKPAGGKLAAVLRPCEIRAFIELVKLKQAGVEDILIIGTDCLGAFPNTAFFRFAREEPDTATARFWRNALSQNPEHEELAAACRSCEHPFPDGADIAISLYGVPVDQQVIVTARTPAGEGLLNKLGLPDAVMPEGRKKAVETLTVRRTEHRDQMFDKTHDATGSLEKLAAYLTNCVNCYNCRVACPVCYCKECVFVTDVFNHDPAQYLRWAERKGAIKMPTDTLFYHLTRLTHMSTACVGCGQCSNACPNDIPVMERFRSVARRTQKAFDYQPGRDIRENPPMSEFRENEFEEVVGISS